MAPPLWAHLNHKLAYFSNLVCVGRTTSDQNRWSFAFRPRRIHPNQVSSLNIGAAVGVAVDAGVAVERQPLWCYFLPTVERKKVLIQTVWGEYVLFVSGWLTESWDLCDANSCHDDDRKWLIQPPTHPNPVGNQQIPGFSCAVAYCLCLIIVSDADIETAPYRP